mgnify:CR=1 FL=1
MSFTQSDFKMAENTQRLSIIVMKRMGKHPLLAYKSLTETNQKKFNRLLNEYINEITIGDSNWRERLKADADQLIAEDIFNEDFCPSKVYVPHTDPNRQLLLSEEQKEFFQENKSEYEKVRDHLAGI